MQLEESDRKWLAGVLEITGRARPSHDLTGSGFPKISLQTFTEQRAKVFEQYTDFEPVFDRNYWISRLSGPVALNLLNTLYPDLPSRRVLINALNRIPRVPLRQRRYYIRHLEDVNYLPTTDEDYDHLILDPDYVAGAIDGAGLWSPNRKKLELLLKTKNFGFQIALLQEYGGDLVQLYQTITKQNATWKINGPELTRFLRFIDQNMRLPKNTGLAKTDLKQAS